MAHPGRMLSTVGIALVALGASACARSSGDDTSATPQSLPSSHPIGGIDDEATTDLPTEAPIGGRAPTPPVSAALDVSTLDDAGLAGVLHSFHQRIAQQAHLAERSSRSTELARVAHEMHRLHSDTMTFDDALFLRLGIVPRASRVSRRVDADSERTLRVLRTAHGAFDHAYLQDQTRTLQESLQVFAQAASVARSPLLVNEFLRNRDDVQENLEAVSREQRSSGIGVTNLQPPSVGGLRGSR